MRRSKFLEKWICLFVWAHMCCLLAWPMRGPNEARFQTGSSELLALVLTLDEWLLEGFQKCLGCCRNLSRGLGCRNGEQLADYINGSGLCTPMEVVFPLRSSVCKAISILA